MSPDDVSRPPLPSARAPSSARPGHVVGGRYRLEGILGRGRGGAVFEATDLTVGGRVAVKVLRGDSAAFAFRHARAAAEVRHPGLVRVLAVSEAPHALVVTELVRGEALRTRIARERRLAPERAATIAGQLLAALSTAHASGVVHGDLRAEHVLVTRAGAAERVKLLGLADASVVPGAELPPATDIYGVGALLFEMLTGQRPFDVVRRRGQASPSLRDAAPGVPLDLALIVDRALLPRAEQRFATCDDMRRAIERWLAGEPEKRAVGLTLLPRRDGRAPTSDAPVAIPRAPRAPSPRSATDRVVPRTGVYVFVAALALTLLGGVAGSLLAQATAGPPPRAPAGACVD
ncbi:MAG: serine/threonine protein kinase [Myxococcales bacterium]|nr:serine/threonine protein kinase [Myxococcales bacterium]